MARDSARNSAGKVEPDRIGRMGGKRRELSVRAACPAVRGFRGKSGSAGGKSSWSGRGCNASSSRRWSVATKPGKAKGSLTRHASYLGATAPALMASRACSMTPLVREWMAARRWQQWAEDRHHFRVIISPERGVDIPDMTAYVREVMARVEKDLVVVGCH